MFGLKYNIGITIIFVMASGINAQALEIQDATHKTNLVGINYSTWHSLAVKKGSTIRNIQEILEGKGEFGPQGSWHFWKEPAVGFYRGDNAFVIDYHFDLSEEAQIDFII